MLREYSVEKQAAGKEGTRFSKSPHDWKDLLSHLNLYNPMNLSLGGNAFITALHCTKVVQRKADRQLHF